MNHAAIAMPPALYVKWGCRRCGMEGGFARCTIPVVGWSEEMMRHLFDTLRERLVVIHARSAPCVASHDDFLIEAGAPPDKTLVGKL